ncbi:NAD(+) synthetase [Haloarcula taiwanensis]|uniref:NH(3)-dependent NAD(+) synthetase n=1 Tax=Haloarcula taiwanensis TaxID=1932004 RepID=A0A2H5A1L5_9EURY|nr:MULTISPECIES: NAD+ synthase [Haloarcula]AUG48614.1 NAD(+) synthetase [Haloarcula taiwanensis]RLM39945.1 NAD+ synthase [Haloarcula sp. Atlit-120R]RLM47955.1 NAD+ synthase [Haloarcula sp. Atlit-47R]RLM96361.1 NAD+ synthase [Haloarcula sp. Atlit-7R]
MATAESIVRADEPLDLSFSDAELEAHRDHITSFITDQVDAAGVDTVVMGLSGGIDSTLVSHLAVEALGRDAVHGLVMPSEANRADNMSDAERVANDLLGIEYDVIEINPLVDAFLDAYPDAEGDQLAVGNLRVRCRAVLNYLAGNHEQALVLGTGNRSEALVGYYTKYGDGAVDCHPIAPLYKQQVRQLAKHVGVPDDLAEKTASAEMWAGQTDADEMGMDYDTLDSILALHVDGGVPAAATADHVGVPTDAVETVREMHESSAHKRAMPPGPDPLY